MNFHLSGGRVGLNCRIIREEDKVIVEEINHGFINDGYDDYLYEDTGLIQLLITLRETLLRWRHIEKNYVAEEIIELKYGDFT